MYKQARSGYNAAACDVAAGDAATGGREVLEAGVWDWVDALLSELDAEAPEREEVEFPWLSVSEVWRSYVEALEAAPAD